jgi:hypothetical protein
MSEELPALRRFTYDEIQSICEEEIHGRYVTMFVHDVIDRFCKVNGLTPPPPCDHSVTRTFEDWGRTVVRCELCGGNDPAAIRKGETP